MSAGLRGRAVWTALAGACVAASAAGCAAVEIEPIDPGWTVTGSDAAAQATWTAGDVDVVVPLHALEITFSVVPPPGLPVPTVNAAEAGPASSITAKPRPTPNPTFFITGVLPNQKRVHPEQPAYMHPPCQMQKPI